MCLQRHGTGDQFITKSCADADTIEVDGVEYPLIKMEISSYSHPFYTGKVKLVDTAGRVDKFRSVTEIRNKLSTRLSKYRPAVCGCCPKWNFINKSSNENSTR